MNFIQRELKSWKIWEIIWLVVATAVIVSVPIYQKDTLVAIFAALTGVWCVILTGKGKISSFIFGTVNTILYAYVAYKAKYYGDVMLNLIYYLPCNFIGMFTWHKNMNKDNGEVKMKRMSLLWATLTLAGSAVAVCGYGLILKKIGGNKPFIDATSTVLSIIAQILCILRFAEQWIIWIIVDIVTILMWALAFGTGGESVATLLCWIIYLTNAIIMFISWERKSNV